ncbi:MAG: putative ABC-type phosphate transporter periplasmic phosphate binding protein [Candidatus Xenolissoclinum pacificiensis L6]|uniref:ABC-type phosphate transporter periplasmic phosphate binding protein n=1 Tax=Candidatus Xenolissoclinum pacificiensis L6 TaxID=1401685 RepID=W2UZD4_9RICK|nr:MAG: putative ABC-type phosphate transporter periplasmic phosphate binding protein [Candidatus Xenolissoclinum pacificiensis L6]
MCVYVTAPARSYIHVVGSSVVYPFMALMSEEFAREYKTHVPVVESLGTGAGVKLFCSGLGVSNPDILMSSRRMTDVEKVFCESNGISEVLELNIGFDGLVFASVISEPVQNFSLQDLFNAISSHILSSSGELLKNQYYYWNEINSSLENKRIEIFGPVRNSGTYQSILDLILCTACLSDYRYRMVYDIPGILDICKSIRDDGTYIEGGVNSNIVVQRMQQKNNIYAIFSYSFLNKNRSLIHANKIDGVLPEYDLIVRKRYPLSRPIYLYVKVDHIQFVPRLLQYLQKLVSDNSIGEYGYMRDIGLIVLSQEERTNLQSKVFSLS